MDLQPLATKMARFGINLPASGGKKRPPLINARTDTLRRGSFKTNCRSLPRRIGARTASRQNSASPL
jgi:hypothetical protein